MPAIRVNGVTITYDVRGSDATGSSSWVSAEWVSADSAPTLVVHGSEYPLASAATGAAIARAIPGARLLELPGSGHLPMWECPRRLADELLQFLDVAG